MTLARINDLEVPTGANFREEVTKVAQHMGYTHFRVFINGQELSPDQAPETVPVGAAIEVRPDDRAGATVAGEGRFQFRVRSNERFEPPHVHVGISNQDLNYCQIELSSGTYKGKPPRRYQRETRVAYEKHALTIKEGWNRIHPESPIKQ